MACFNPSPAVGESTLTDAMTAAGKTYEEIAQMVAEQVGATPGVTYWKGPFFFLTPVFFLFFGIGALRIFIWFFWWPRKMFHFG